MTRKQRRLTLVLSTLGIVAVAVFLVMSALRDSIVFFYSPTELLTRDIEIGQTIRIGGLVEDGSVRRGEGTHIKFAVTDLAETVAVEFNDILPDLFREGQGIVVTGNMRQDGVFEASEVLAKHDENYMPSEVADALKDSGRWQHYKDGETSAEDTSQVKGD